MVGAEALLTRVAENRERFMLLNRLTPRQRQVVELVFRTSARATGRKLGLRPAMVRLHWGAAKYRLGADWTRLEIELTKVMPKRVVGK